MKLKNNNVGGRPVTKGLFVTDSGYNSPWFSYLLHLKANQRERNKVTEIQPIREELQTSFFYLLERIARSFRWSVRNRKYQHHNHVDWELRSAQLLEREWWRVFLDSIIPGCIPKHFSNKIGK